MARDYKWIGSVEELAPAWEREITTRATRAVKRDFIPLRASVGGVKTSVTVEIT